MVEIVKSRRRCGFSDTYNLDRVSEEGSTNDKALPQEFRENEIRIARVYQTSARQVALNFSISVARHYQWLQKAEIKEDLREVASSDQVVAN
jgi:hypothetical protein